MFDDIVKPKVTERTATVKIIKIPIEFLEDIQEIMWDLVAEPCIYCGQETGSQHKNDCKYVIVMEEIDYQLLKHRRL